MSEIEELRQTVQELTRRVEQLTLALERLNARTLPMIQIGGPLLPPREAPVHGFFIGSGSRLVPKSTPENPAPVEQVPSMRGTRVSCAVTGRDLGSAE